MADLKQTVTQRNVEGVDETGGNVRQVTKEVHTERAASSRTVASNLVWYLFGLIAILLATRFVLLLTGANSENGFVSFVYSFSHIFSAPFDTIFGASKVGGTQSVFQPSVLVAIAVYALIAWGAVKLINIAQRNN